MIIQLLFRIVYQIDDIWEDLANEGAISAFLEQPFPYVNIHRLFLNCAESEHSFFDRCSYSTGFK